MTELTRGLALACVRLVSLVTMPQEQFFVSTSALKCPGWPISFGLCPEHIEADND